MINLIFLLIVFLHFVDMASAAFIEPLPVVEFVGQLLGKDVMSRPLSDADRIKVINTVTEDAKFICYSVIIDQFKELLFNV